MFVLIGSLVPLSAQAAPAHQPSDAIQVIPSAWKAEGNQGFAFFGGSVASAGDVNGDGFQDAIIGASNYNGVGRALVYHGSASGLSKPPAWYAEGDQGNGSFGWSVATAGDVNADGFDDVIVGAFGQGKAFVYHGSATGLSFTPSWIADMPSVYSVSTAGDVNGDGYADVIVGRDGQAWVYQGSESGLSSADWMVEGGGAFGLSVGTAGDVNGDGYDDVIVGAPYGAPGAFVYHGSAAGLSASPDWTAGDGTGAFGNSVGTAGDVNGDGYDDVVVGSPGYTHGQFYEGAAFVYHGSASGLATDADWLAESNDALSYFGTSAGTAGDTNGDGFDEVIVGGPYLSQENGGAFIYHGSLGGLGLLPSSRAKGDQGLAAFGNSVATAGDVNADGFADAIVGATYYDHGAIDEGAAFVFAGAA
jgi:hypothetical protein